MLPLLALALAAAPAVTLSPAVARPGDAVLVRVATPAGAPLPEGTLAGRPLHFWRNGAEAWGLASLPLETAPGAVPLLLGGAEAPAAALRIVEPGFPSKALTVAPRFVTPPASVKARIARDRKAFAAAYDRPFAPPRFAASFAWPHPGAHHGRFGDQRVFNGKKASVHYGLDVEAERGDPVTASNDGEVVLARDCYYSGNTVIVWHGADVFTLYFHMEKLLAKPGQQVRRGDKLGLAGSTGRSTGPHLHFSARVDGLLVDPESLVAIDLAAGTAPARRAGPPAAPAPEPAVPLTPAGAPPAAPPPEVVTTAQP